MRKTIAWALLVLILIWGSAGAELIDNDDGTVTDTSTGLMWQKATGFGGRTLTWEEAVIYCQVLFLAGYDDWRLPDRNELQSLVDYTTYDPAVDVNFFPDTRSFRYGSSTSSADNTGHAWSVSFYGGYVDTSSKIADFYVRAVRGGH